MGSAGFSSVCLVFFFDIILLKIHLNTFSAKTLSLRRDKRCWGTGKGSVHLLKPWEVSKLTKVTGITRQVWFETVP